MQGSKLVLVASFAALAGCVAGPDKPSPSMSLPASFSEGSHKSNGAVAENAWWKSFSDPLLNSYVARGQTGNLDVALAAEQVNQAKSAAIAASSGALPSGTLTGSATASYGDATSSQLQSKIGASNTENTAASVSWLLDFFGRYKRAREAADATLDSSYRAVEVVRLAFLSQAVTAYIDTRYYQASLDMTRKNIASLERTLDLTKSMQTSGQATLADVVRAQSQVDAAKANLPGLDSNYHRSSYVLAQLLGLPANALDKDIERGGRQPVPHGVVDDGIPADLVRNRPDIRKAETDLVAATANIGVAEAQLYPSITLNGSISLSHIALPAATGEASTWSFGPQLNLPIFDGGALRANVDIARSKAEAAYITWKATILKGVQETQSAMIALRRARQTLVAQQKVVESSQKALDLARQSYQAGATSLLDVLDAERSLSTANLNLASAVRNLANSYVTLNVAIGGGAKTGANGSDVTKKAGRIAAK